MLLLIGLALVPFRDWGFTFVQITIEPSESLRHLGLSLLNNHKIMKDMKFDKYGLLVSTKISDHDMRIIEKLESMLKARKDEDTRKNS